MKGNDKKIDTVQFDGEGHTLLSESSSKAFNEEGGEWSGPKNVPMRMYLFGLG